MSNILEVALDCVCKKVFLPVPLYEIDSPLHKHHYAEIHMILSGNMEFTIENKIYKLEAGDIIAVPSNAYHLRKSVNSDVITSAFQIDADCRKTVACKMPLSVLEEFFNEIKNMTESTNCSKILSYIALVCSYLGIRFYSENDIVTDDAFLIGEFFSERYNEDITIENLMQILHLSKKQTQLLIKKHTGRTFREELTETRMRVARYMTAHTDMSMKEISEAVGYRTYSGFWKNYKVYCKKCK